MGRLLYDDPEVVRPERWIPFKNPSPYEFPVFQAGPRICLGMNMAILETKILVIRLLQEFNFTLQPGEAEKIICSPMITMAPCNSSQADSHELLCIPHPRSK
jgi:cytochrome P450